jgi:putative endonuclease
VHTVDAFWVYILASKPRGTLYIGVTNGLIRRVEEHARALVPGFTHRYRVHTLVWFQEFASANEAIQREKTMKEWPRAWKINLIEQTNPHWQDLYPSLPGVKPVTDDWFLGALDPGNKCRDDD